MQTCNNWHRLNLPLTSRNLTKTTVFKMRQRLNRLSTFIQASSPNLLPTKSINCFRLRTSEGKKLQPRNKNRFFFAKLKLVCMLIKLEVTKGFLAFFLLYSQKIKKFSLSWGCCAIYCFFVLTILMSFTFVLTASTMILPISTKIVNSSRKFSLLNGLFIYSQL